jgi:hypothetical protein
MAALDLAEASWQKSRYSSANGCVEVAVLPDTVAVRDSKDRGGPVLMFNQTEWRAFVGAVKDGQFDL